MGITIDQKKKSTRTSLLSWTDLTFKEPSSKSIVKSNHRTKKPTMTEIHTNKIHKDSIKVNPSKDIICKVKLNDYYESVLNPLTKLVGKTHISYFVCMGIKKNKKVKKKEIRKNTK